MKDFVTVTVDTSELVRSALSSYVNIVIVSPEVTVDTSGEVTSNDMLIYEVGSYEDLNTLAEDETIPTTSQAYKSAVLAYKNGAARVWIAYGTNIVTEDTAVYAKKMDMIKNVKDKVDALPADTIVFAGLVETKTEKYITGDTTNSKPGLIDFVKAANTDKVTPRIGIYMLESGDYPGKITTTGDQPATYNYLGESTMIGICHTAVNPTDGVTDVAAMVAGALGAFKPSVSPVRKPLVGATFSGTFTASQSAAIEKKQLNEIATHYASNGEWYLGTFYTQVRKDDEASLDGKSTDARLQGDLVRVINYVSRKLEENLSKSSIIGTLRVNVSGITALGSAINTILAGLVADDIIENKYSLTIPLASIIAKQESERTATEQAVYTRAVLDRVVDAKVQVSYNGVIYFININPLKFTM